MDRKKTQVEMVEAICAKLGIEPVRFRGSIIETKETRKLIRAIQKAEKESKHSKLMFD